MEMFKYYNELLLIFRVLQILEGKSYKLQFPWIGVVNRSQADINKSVDMIAARRREREYFQTSPEYQHLAQRMGSEHLGKMLSKVYRGVTESSKVGINANAHERLCHVCSIYVFSFVAFTDDNPLLNVLL